MVGKRKAKKEAAVINTSEDNKVRFLSKDHPLYVLLNTKIMYPLRKMHGVRLLIQTFSLCNKIGMKHSDKPNSFNP